jgi:hypothetical protein
MRVRLVLALLILVAVQAAPVLARQQPAETASKPEAPPAASDRPLTLTDLFSADKESLIGSPITLRNLQVRDKTRRQALWVGRSAEQMILVTMPATVHALYPDGRRANLDKGAIIHITAIVQRAPLPHMLEQGWGVRRQDTSLVERSGVILNAMKIEVAN